MGSNKDGEDLKHPDPGDLGFGRVLAEQVRGRFLNKDGTPNSRKYGMGSRQFQRLQLRALHVSWPSFVVWLFALLLLANGIFALAYLGLGPAALGGADALQLPDANTDSYFTKIFGRPVRELTCECERTTEPNIAQALHLANGDTLNAKLHAPEGFITKILAAKKPAGQWLEDATFATLARAPFPAETQAVQSALADSKDAPRIVMEDTLWALLSSREFLFNH